MQKPGTIEGTFQLTWVSPTMLGQYYDGAFDPFTRGLECFAFQFAYYVLHWFQGGNPPISPCFVQIVLPSTRRIFQVNQTDFSYSMLLYTNNGIGGSQVTVIPAKYVASGDPVIEIIPCVCDFSMDCNTDGTVAVGNYNHRIFINNQAPVPGFFGPGAVTIPAGTPNVTLNGNMSLDRDFSPNPFLTYFWKPYNITNYTLAPVTGIPMFSIQNETSVVTVAYTMNLAPGLYVAILYVSDGQIVTFGLFNFTVLANIITAVAPADFAVHIGECTSEVTPECVPLNASLSFETATDRTLLYNWTAVSGWNVWPATFSTVCNAFTGGLFNYTSVIACFVPPFLGLYQFNVTVYDNISATSTDYVFVNVVPQGAPLIVPNITINPFPSAPIRTDPPINRPVLPFPNATGPPISEAPFAETPTTNTSVPTVFPVYPPMTPSQLVSMFSWLIIATLVFVIFAALLIVTQHTDAYNFLDRVRYFQQ